MGHQVLLLELKLDAVRNRSVVQAAESYALGEQPLALLSRLPGPWQPVRGARSAVVPEPAGAAARFGRGPEPDDRVGALRGRSQQRSCRFVEARQRGSHAGGVRPARVHRVDHDAGAGQLLAQSSVRITSARLVRAYTVRPVELPVLALQVIDPELLRVHAAGGHVDDPRRGALLEQWDQQVRQQERADDVGRERELDPVGREHRAPRVITPALLTSTSRRDA